MSTTLAKPDLWTKLVAGGASRKSRLHDGLGSRVPVGSLVRNGPRALATGLLRLLFGWRPERPWISYEAQALIAPVLTKDSVVLEFGSGMSTIWYARRAGHLISIEDDRGWFDSIADRLARHKNVDYRFAADKASYVGQDDRQYDLIMIDGKWRDECARFAVDHLRPGGIIYLDNCDNHGNQINQLTGDIPQARQLLKRFASEHGLPVREFTDFAPTQLFAARGLMIGGPPA